MLPYLAASKELVKQRLTHYDSMQELAGYDVVVNCTGLGAAELFGDTSMFPIKGHVIRVHAPWIKSIYFVSSWLV